ncbi:MAG: hypothetical protein U0559_07455 [Anaerolineae bacterium]
MSVVLAVAIGLSAGLAIGWYVWPVTYTEAAPSRLRQDWKDEAIWMAAQAFAYDRDLEAAQSRLRPLGSEDVGQLVLDRAERARQQNWPVAQITHLARLAAALGAHAPDLDRFLNP